MKGDNIVNTRIGSPLHIRSKGSKHKLNRIAKVCEQDAMSSFLYYCHTPTMTAAISNIIENLSHRTSIIQEYSRLTKRILKILKVFEISPQTDLDRDKETHRQSLPRLYKKLIIYLVKTSVLFCIRQALLWMEQDIVQ